MTQEVLRLCRVATLDQLNKSLYDAFCWWTDRGKQLRAALIRAGVWEGS